jgi:hypothetical protein
MGVTGGTPYGWDVGTKAGTPGGPFIEGLNQAVVGMAVRCKASERASGVMHAHTHARSLSC